MNIDALLQAMALKQVSRTGWMMNGIDPPETVSSHSWGVVLPIPSGCDRSKLLQMAVVHDLAEVSTGDIVVEGERSHLREARDAAERDFFTQFFKDRSDLRVLAMDACAFKGIEGEVLEQLDKVDMALQAYFYSKSTGIDLKQFLVSARKPLKFEYYINILDDLEARL